MAKIIHCADFHLDSKFHGSGHKEAVECRQLQRETIKQIVDIANSDGYDLVLIAGDLFDNAKIYPETLEFLTKIFTSCNCPICIAPGNHDFYSTSSPYATYDFGRNVFIFKENRVSSFDFPEINTTIWGAAFTASNSPCLMNNFPKLEKNRINIGLFHGDFDNKNSEYSPISKENIANSKLQYVALGHIHKATRPLSVGGTTLAYSGCTMGRGFDECGAKGMLLGEVTQTSCSMNFAPLSGIIYDILHILVDNDLFSAIENCLNSDYSNHMLRLILEGQCPALDVPRLEAVFGKQVRGLTILDHTRRPSDIWNEAGENNLRGLFLQELKNNLADYPELTTMAAKFGLAVMEGREVDEL
ncbi:MAG: DNA repair exonuclease [Eubacteriales bacterium]